MPDPLARSPRLSLSNAGALSPRVGHWLDKLVAADLAAVRALTGAERSRLYRLCAIAISKLGNGWIYPILAASVFVEWGWIDGRRVVLLAAINAAVMHVMYPLIKKRFKRLRPFKVDPQLPSLMKTLDEHSFPSGHAMTLTGVLAPIVMIWPAALVSALVMACCMAWSRIATGHHYPSDVAAGVALGVGVGYPLSANLAAFF
ncbi:MAG TPA: phosphatase PAP2 family protein [Methylocystis sp.]|nr:phosphatase PAP2 family protein [Methylocystis sp.]